ncbi:MAG: Sua5 family C-terminal domain-containing protein, partial [Candidatus Bathyarchaeia archaeon]
DETSPKYDIGVVKSLGSRSNLLEIARSVFKLLREFDKEGVDIILAEGVPSTGLGLAVMNRLRKASGYNIIRV